MATDILFFQFFEAESSTYTYLIGDPVTGEAALIDPVLETVERDLRWISELGIKLKYVLDTHVHADHVTAAGEVRRRTGAKTAVSRAAGVDCADLSLSDGDELALGQRKIRALMTPGHTDSCMSFLFEGRVFTGDALLIRGNGRTDFQQGSADRLYDSVRGKLFALPDETLVYPAHDYRGQMCSTIALEKKYNPRLGADRQRDDFVRIMAELKLDNPKKMDIAVPANMACGAVQKGKTMNPRMVNGIPEISVEELQPITGKVRLIDVRRPDEFSAELGHIAGAELVTLGPDLVAFLEKGNRDESIVFVCRSGGRSGQATAESLRLGYKSVANMTGGMLRWNEVRFPTQK